MAIPRVEPEPFSVSDAAAGAPDPAEEVPELKPLQASLTALRSEGDAEPAAEPAAFLPFGAAELANTGWPFCTVTPAVEPLSRAANCWLGGAAADAPGPPEPAGLPAGCVAPPLPPPEGWVAVRRPGLVA